ncbi:unnamed protein product [Moneuplotes crassus]|uniref:Uncharacterized protein n=1 Tax=Euplotes crassus TaxID=5936 RepID=A0AAD1XTS6_EUPCR|nr:unnamed protein product [Moneuplotes crassus]
MGCINLSDCILPKYLLSSDQYTLTTICRNLNYYIDPFSDKNIELGTKDFPYRSFTLLSSELVNILSNSNYNVIIYTNDAYLKHGELSLINLTSVSLKPLLDYAPIYQEDLQKKTFNKPLLIPTHFDQHGITEKAHFHALKSTHTQAERVLDEGGFTDYEVNTFTLKTATIKSLRTSIEIDGIDFYSEEIDYNQPNILIFPIYFQNRLLKITNCNFNVTGEVVSTHDPYNVYLKNIVVEGYTLRHFVSDWPAQCNYPEAFVHATFFAQNISYVIYKDRTTTKISEFLISSGPSNVTYEDIDMGKFYITPGDGVSACSVGVESSCVPNDEGIQTINFHGFKSQLENHIAPTNKYILNAVMSFIPHYRSLVMNYTNFEYRDFRNYEPTILMGFICNPIDRITLSNFNVLNARSLSQFFGFNSFSSLSLSNFVFQEIYDTHKLLYLNLNIKVSLSNITIQNYSTSKKRTGGDILINPLPVSEIIIDGLHLQNCSIVTFPLVQLSIQPLGFVIKNSIYENILMDGSIPLLKLASIASFEILNQTLSGVKVNEGDEPLNSFIEITHMTLLPSSVNFVDNIRMEEADISLIKFSKVVSQAESKVLSISNLDISSTNFQRSRSIISTEGFEVDGDIQLTFQNFTVRNISFVTSGQILQLSHRLLNPIMVKDSLFENISSGTISMQILDDSDSKPKSKLRMENCTFRGILNTIKPFIDFSKNGHFEITKSNFSEITSVSESFGIVYLSGNSFGSFAHCVFTNNSALSSTVFKVESKSMLGCSQCSIDSNFALKYGVFEIASGSRIILKNSQIYQNFAIQNSIGSILETVDTSEFVNCSIFENSVVTNNKVIQEVQGTCTEFCMMSNDLKEYLTQNLGLIDKEEISIFAISLISGLLKINQGTQIYNQSYLMSCFLSDIEISDASLHSIIFSRIYIFVISSNMTLENISFGSINKVNSGIIFGISEVILYVKNVTYKDSSALFLLSSSSEVHITAITFQNISQVNYLLNIGRSEKAQLDNIKIINCSVVLNCVINIRNTKILRITNMVLSNYSKTLFLVRNSNVSLISNLHVSHYYRAIEAINTNIELITNSSFSLSGASDLLYAGAVLLQNSNATLLNTTFTQNKAMTGAAITSLCSDSTDCNVAINKCAFENNSATVKGGAIYYDYRPPVVDTNTVFANNSAQYGRDFASYPVMVRLVKGNSSDEIVIDRVSPGIAIDQQISLALYDGNRQVMTLDNSSQINIMSQTQNSSIKGINVKRVIQGAAEFTSLIAVAEPGSSNIKYSISSKTIDKVKIYNAFRDSVTQPGITINFSYCKPGQQVIDGQCYECPAGTYSFVWNSTKCHQCEDNAACLGKQQMEVAKGYWRRSTNSTDIVECIQEEACEGGYHPENEHPVKCATGYTGKLCSECKITKEKKYHKIDLFECQVCPDPIFNAIRVVCLIILLFAFFMVIIITNVRKTEESEFSILLRILTNYLQIITTSMSMTTKYPSSLTDTFLPLNRLGDSSQTFLSFDCFIADYEVKGIFSSNSVLKLFLVLLLPLIIFCIVALIWIGVMLIKKDLVKDMKRNLTISFISILFILHPKLTESGINTFRCIGIDKNTYAARIDTDIGCYSTTHLKWCLLIATPILLIWVVSIPAIGLIVLYKAQKQNNHKILAYFLILYQGLKDDKFYWEFLNTLRKVLIVLSFLLPKIYKIAFPLMIMIASERLERRLKPYKEEEHNNITLLSTMAGIITLDASYVYDLDEKISHLNSCILVLVIIFNAKFILEWTYLCLKLFRSKSKVIEYIFLTVSKLLCRKVQVEKSEEEQTSPKDFKKVLKVPQKQKSTKSRKKRRKSKFRKAKKNQRKNKKSEVPVEGATSKVNDTTLRVFLYCHFRTCCTSQQVGSRWIVKKTFLKVMVSLVE